MLTVVKLALVLAVPLLGANLALSGRTLSRSANAMLMGGLLLWLLLFWSITLRLAWPAVQNALQILPV